MATDGLIGTFISQLRANAPVFGGRVAGAAEFYSGLRNYNANLTLPAAYVMPLGQDAERNSLLGSNLQQIIHKHIGIAVELNASPDRRGQSPTMDFDVIEAQILTSCLNLFVGVCRMNSGAYLSGAHFLDLDRARLFYQWEFGLDWQITDEDGVQPDQGVPLREIDVEIHLAPLDEHPEPAAVIHIVTDDDAAAVNRAWWFPSWMFGRWGKQ